MDGQKYPSYVECDIRDESRQRICESRRSWGACIIESVNTCGCGIGSHGRGTFPGEVPFGT